MALTLMPLRMALSGYSTANWSCTTRVNLCVEPKYSQPSYLTRSQGNVVVARELARRYGDKIVSTSLHPGNIRTDLLRHQPGWRNAIVVRPFVACHGGRWLTLAGVHRIGLCTRHHMEHLHSFTARRHLLQRMP